MATALFLSLTLLILLYVKLIGKPGTPNNANNQSPGVKPAIVPSTSSSSSWTDADSDQHRDVSDAKYLELNRNKPGVVVQPSGLQYRVLRQGSGTRKPGLHTKCDVRYRGTFPSGKEFDSASRATFAPDQVIKGWTEAMQMMVEGDKWELVIPYDLAYGEEGSPADEEGDVGIPPRATLVFTMELLKIKD